MAARRPLFDAARRIAKRMEPSVAKAYLTAIERIEARIDATVAADIARTGNIPETVLVADAKLTEALRSTMATMGQRTSDVLAQQLKVPVVFNQAAPQVVLFAKNQSSTRIAAIGEETRESIKIALAIGHEQSLTTDQVARVIRAVVGLPPNQAAAPLRFAQEIRDGDIAAATARRLSATDIAQINSRITKGTVDEPFVEQMQQRYVTSLRNARGKTIARTEVATASHAGQRESFRQAIAQDILPEDARQFWEDSDNPCPVCSPIPEMNPDGVAIDEQFDTPAGPIPYPPAHPNCECSTSLRFPGANRPGVLR